jgi:PBP1b-binding outer membrane lipoprotein LpoB
MFDALPGLALICLLALMLGGCKATKPAPVVSASSEPRKAVSTTSFEPEKWPLRLTRL